MQRFNETQRIRFWPLWAAIGCMNFIFGFVFVYQVLMGHPFGRIPLPNTLIIILFLIMLGILVFFLMVNLKLLIDDVGIHYKFAPFQRKFTTITWYEVSDAYVRDYEPMYEYGGWGMKGTEQSRLLSISGKKGLQLVMGNGKRVLLGTRRPVEVKAIAQYYFRP
jgi:hypothetical protein